MVSKQLNKPVLLSFNTKRQKKKKKKKKVTFCQQHDGKQKKKTVKCGGYNKDFFLQVL